MDPIVLAVATIREMPSGRQRFNGVPRSRWISVLLVAGVAVVAVVAMARLVAGPGVPTFRVDFPQGQIERPMSVVVEDHDGSVTAVERAAVPDERQPEGNFGSAPISGEGSTVTVWWVGGACERETTVRVTTRAGGLHLDIRSPRALIGSCPAVGILRAVRLHLALPIDLSEVAISFEPA
jgi:hypothetical protein